MSEVRQKRGIEMKFPCMLHRRIVNLVRGSCISGYVCPIADMTQTECRICNQMHGYLLPRLCDRKNCPSSACESSIGEHASVGRRR